MTGDAMVTVRLKFLVRDADRHGNLRLYVRRPGHGKIRLPVAEDHVEFAAAYAAALKGEAYVPLAIAKPAEIEAKPTKAVPGSIRALVQDYLRSADWKTAGERTRYVRRSLLDEICDTPLNPESPRRMGECPVRLFTVDHVVAIRDRKAEVPEGANNRLKALRALFKWAVPKHAKANPAKDVPLFPPSQTGFPTWTVQDIEKFGARHPVGTKAHLAFALLFYLGQRRSDITALGRQHVRDGEIRFTQFKGRNRKPVAMVLPILPELQSVIERSPCGEMTYLVTEFGKPFSHAGFGNWFRDRCDEAGVTGKSAHGLRKALQALGAELGLTDRELMAIAGHASAKETDRYTRAAQRSSMARSGMAKLTGRLGKESVPPKEGLEKSGTNRAETTAKSGTV